MDCCARGLNAGSALFYARAPFIESGFIRREIDRAIRSVALPRFAMALRDRGENRLACRDRRVESGGKAAAFGFELPELAKHNEIAFGDLLQKLSAGRVDAVGIEVAGGFRSRGFDVDREGLSGNDVAEVPCAADAIFQPVHLGDKSNDVQSVGAPP